jgi:hypothetical protein
MPVLRLTVYQVKIFSVMPVLRLTVYQVKIFSVSDFLVSDAP